MIWERALPMTVQSVFKYVKYTWPIASVEFGFWPNGKFNNDMQPNNHDAHDMTI